MISNLLPKCCLALSLSFVAFAAARPEAPPPVPAITAIEALAVSPDGKGLAVAGSGRAVGADRLHLVEIRDLETRLRSVTLLGHDRPVARLAFSPDGSRLAGAVQNAVFVWDLRQQRLERKLTLRSGPVLALAFSSADKALVVLSGSSGEGAAITWLDPATGKALHTAAAAPANAWSGSVGVSRDGSVLAVTLGNSIRVYDARSRGLLRAFPPEERTLDAAELSPRGDVVAVGDRETVTLWDVQNGRKRGEYRLEAAALGLPGMTTPRVMALSFSPGGDTLAMVIDSGTRLPGGVVVFQSLTDKARVLSRHRTWGRVTHFAFTRDGGHLVYGEGKEIYLLARATGQASLFGAGREK